MAYRLGEMQRKRYVGDWLLQMTQKNHHHKPQDPPFSHEDSRDPLPFTGTACAFWGVCLALGELVHLFILFTQMSMEHVLSARRCLCWTRSSEGQ